MSKIIQMPKSEKINMDWAKTKIPQNTMYEMELVVKAQKCYLEGKGIPPETKLMMGDEENVVIMDYYMVNLSHKMQEYKLMMALDMDWDKNQPMWITIMGWTERELRERMIRVMEAPTSMTRLEETTTIKELRETIQEAPQAALRVLYQILLTIAENNGAVY